MMYWVRHEETTVLYHPVEAESEKEALEKFETDAENGKVNFARADTIKSVTTAEKEKVA